MVYVDNPQLHYRSMKMCHMVADTLEELHEMADKIGLKRSWYQPKSSPHYDVCLSKRKLAVEFGAQEVGIRKIAEIVIKNRDFLKSNENIKTNL